MNKRRKIKAPFWGDDFLKHFRFQIGDKVFLALLVAVFLGFSACAMNTIDSIFAQDVGTDVSVQAPSQTVENVDSPMPQNGQWGPNQPGGQPGQMRPQPGQMNPGGQGMGQPGQQMNPGGQGMGQPGQQMGPGGQGMGQPGQQMGPSEADMQKMNDQRLSMMKQGLDRFLKEMARVKKNVASYEKKITIPEELKAAIAKIDELSVKIKETSDPDELQDAVDNFQDSLDVIQEWMPMLPQLVQLPKVLKQADKEIAKAEKAYTADAAKIAKAKLDLADVLAEFRTAIDEQKGILNEIKELAKTDPGEALMNIREEFFDTLDNMWENDKVIQTALNLKRSLPQMAKEIKSSESTIKNLKKKKIDTAELESLLGIAKTEYADLSKLAAAKPMDFEAVIDALDNLMATKQEFSDKVQELTGQSDFQPQLGPVQNFQLNIPQGFDMGGDQPGQNASSANMKQPLNNFQLK